LTHLSFFPACLGAVSDEPRQDITTMEKHDIWANENHHITITSQYIKLEIHL